MPLKATLTALGYTGDGVGRSVVLGAFMTELRRGVHALWQAIFGEPPSVDAEPSLLCELLVRHMPPAPPYGGPPPPDGPEAADNA